MSPPIQVFLTTIASQPALRQRQEYILRILQVRKIPFLSYDLASDENAKRLWRRKGPKDKPELPGILVGGKWPGSFQDFEEAVEYGELDTFLRLNEDYDPEIEEDHPLLPAGPVGVPGAASPLQMNKDHKPSYSATPSPLRKKTGKEHEEFDVGEELTGFGLQGVKVTNAELLKLAEELGLSGDDAKDLVGGLGALDLGDGAKEDAGDNGATGSEDRGEQVTPDEKNDTKAEADPAQVEADSKAANLS
ncbi:hypothetical protein SISNIDRAFT_483397 [Sistotremastrum niveocremeum HHB9708]|uniref:Uncharacterized protein n=1 Tax=Sistotremastrum niveocremeum HHB9708 TaxID=1314777 RepID=A0A164XHL0_9AGAM|nr:hypothetical protein SISNIDRAFT_483397 [Sistotremastrum niveocremeum HHB9708]